jgi:hypothetical protein
MRARATFLTGKLTRRSRAPVTGRRETNLRDPQEKRTVKGAAVR